MTFPMEPMKSTIIVLLTALVLWMSVRIVELENYHYGNSVGMCREFSFIDRDRCLHSTETRTHWLWHLAYGLKLI